MDSKATWVQQAGVTPAKLMLIGVLAVVLGGVLYLQFGGSGVDAPSSVAQPPVTSSPETDKPQPSAAAGTAVTTIGTPRKKGVVLNNWQPPDLASVVQYDPFALPASFPQPRSTELEGALAQAAGSIQDAAADKAAREAQLQQMQSQLEGLRHEGVHAIIKRHDHYVAIIGDQEIHVGDEINGFTVIAIDADGVRVARDLSQ